MKSIRFWTCVPAVTALVVGIAMSSAASDAKKVEHAGSGAAHRVSQGFHKQVKDYHIRQARQAARRGQYRKAHHHAHKARWHGAAERRQERTAQRKERAVRHE
jgi:hypothetical protein